MAKKSAFSTEYRLLCRLLREARERAGLTQLAVAKQLKRPQSYVSKYESGERRLDVIEFVRVAAALNMDACELLSKVSE